MCRECFYRAFEEEVHKTIIDAQLFKTGDRVAVGASGGKGGSYINSCLKSLQMGFLCFGEEFVI